MGKKGKVHVFKGMKEVIELYFPDHETFTQRDWFKEIKDDFIKVCKRYNLEDENVSQQRQSVPLYRSLKRFPR